MIANNFRFSAFQFGGHLGYHTGMYYLDCDSFKLIQKYTYTSIKLNHLKNKTLKNCQNENIHMNFTSLVVILNAKFDQ